VNDAEMRNFSAAECGKAIRGSLRNVPHLIFRKLPLDNFPHSAIRIPQNTRALTAVIPVTGGISPVAVVDKFPAAG